MMDDREVVLIKTEDSGNAVEFLDATLAWEKARTPAAKTNPPPKKQFKMGGMKRVLRREKLSLYISTDDGKESKEGPNAQSLLTNMEQESPQSTISSTQSMRPPLHKTLHRIDLRIKRVSMQCFRLKSTLLSCLTSAMTPFFSYISRVHWLASVEVSVVERAPFCLLYWDRWEVTVELGCVSFLLIKLQAKLDASIPTMIRVFALLSPLLLPHR